MKKIMIALAAVSMAVAANAAATTWSIYAYEMPNPGDLGGYYTGSATVSCAALGFESPVSIVEGYFEIADVPIDCAKDSYYDFVLTASKAVPGGTWNYVDGYEENGYVDDNGNGQAGFFGGEWTFTPSPVPPTPTPEPTSGLLLLLGVAGLALRRKQK